MTTPHEHRLRGCLLWLLASGAFALLCLGGGLAYAFHRQNEHLAPTGYAGDPERGRALVTAYGCVSCHDPGQVGPPLQEMATRGYLAGRFPNVPGVMQQWLRDPQSLKPGTAMPNLGVTRRDADDIAAYLATLR